MKSELDRYVIDQIKAKRKELNVSQRDIAELLKCNRSFVGQVESDNFPAKYSVQQVYAIAQDFECSPSDFFPPIDDPRFNSDS